MEHHEDEGGRIEEGVIESPAVVVHIPNQRVPDPPQRPPPLVVRYQPPFAPSLRQRTSSVQSSPRSSDVVSEALSLSLPLPPLPPPVPQLALEEPPPAPPAPPPAPPAPEPTPGLITQGVEAARGWLIDQLSNPLESGYRLMYRAAIVHGGGMIIFGVMAARHEFDLETSPATRRFATIFGITTGVASVASIPYIARQPIGWRRVLMMVLPCAISWVGYFFIRGSLMPNLLTVVLEFFRAYRVIFRQINHH